MDTRESDAGWVDRSAARLIYLVTWTVALLGLATGVMIVAGLVFTALRAQGPTGNIPTVSGVPGATSALLA
ncbi:MAG TPA: hypothetical protein VFC00_22745, partial [Micromonosporaceae bacterium]|nr:hypothetical protein [Micromonosporaceae bacterium]